MTEAAQVIKGIIAEKLRVSPQYVDEDCTLHELGLDSLGAAEVVLAVEQRFSVALDMSVIKDSVQPDTKLSELLALMSNMVST